MRTQLAISVVLTFVISAPLWAATNPNTIVILVDDLGFADPACNKAGSKMHTPNIDRIAKEGMRFTDAHAPASWCTPTQYGLANGRYPYRTDLDSNKGPVVEEGRLTLRAMLHQHGFRTVMVDKWYLGFEIVGRDRSKRHRGGPVDRGFERYFGIPSSLNIPRFYFIEEGSLIEPPNEQVAARNAPGWSLGQDEFWRAGGIAPGLRHIDVLPELTERAEKEIVGHDFEHDDKPLFMYLALPTPSMPTGEFAGKSKVPLYGDFVQRVEATVGRIMSVLDETGMRRTRY